MRALLFIITLFFVTTDLVIGQISKKISPQDFYDFYNSMKSKDTLKTIQLSDAPSTGRLLKDTSTIFLDTIFSTIDKNFIREQLFNFRDFSWTKGNLIHVKILSHKKISRTLRDLVKGWKRFYLKFGDGFATYSIPVFTVDRKYCIVNINWHCGGLCGSGGTNLYRKVSGKWVFVKFYSFWIS